MSDVILKNLPLFPYEREESPKMSIMQSPSRAPNAREIAARCVCWRPWACLSYPVKFCRKGIALASLFCAHFSAV